MFVSRHPAWQEFVKTFNSIGRHRHRYEVFRDFVTMSAISVHNAVRKDEGLESEYLQIVGKYEKDDADMFCVLFAKLVWLLDAEPVDVLGALYMSLELGNVHAGQFFTPPEVSELMARVTYGDQLRDIAAPFITVCEPACGAGGMVLAFTKVMLSHGHNPSEKIWVQCQDIDRLAALMCYLQLSLWNIPAVVIVGNTLASEAREVFYTPQHYLGFWGAKLKRHHEQMSATAQSVQERKETFQQVSPEASVQKAMSAGAVSKIPDSVPAANGVAQFDFGF